MRRAWKWSQGQATRVVRDSRVRRGGGGGCARGVSEQAWSEEMNAGGRQGGLLLELLRQARLPGAVNPAQWRLDNDLAPPRCYTFSKLRTHCSVALALCRQPSSRQPPAHPASMSGTGTGPKCHPAQPCKHLQSPLLPCNHPCTLCLHTLGGRVQWLRSRQGPCRPRRRVLPAAADLAARGPGQIWLLAPWLCARVQGGPGVPDVRQGAPIRVLCAPANGQVHELPTVVAASSSICPLAPSGHSRTSPRAPGRYTVLTAGAILAPEPPAPPSLRRVLLPRAPPAGLHFAHLL